MTDDATTTTTSDDARLSPDVGEMRLARVRAAVDHVLTTTRRGYQSQVEKLLNPEQLVAIGLMKACGDKTEEIHSIVVADLFAGDAENAPNYQALYRWVTRFGETYKRLRAVDHDRLMREWHRQQQGVDGLAGEANYGLARMAEMVNATLLDCDDPRELTNGQLGNFGAILSSAAKAAREERKLDKAIEYTEQRERLLEAQTRQAELRNEQLERAVRETVEAVEQEAKRSADGRVDAKSIMATLRAQIMGERDGEEAQEAA